MAQSVSTLKSSIREVFDDFSLSVIYYLENHPAVTDVRFMQYEGCAEHAINAWETRNAPYLLPDDLKAFLSISDGVKLRWSVSVPPQPDGGNPLGSVHVNCLDDIKSVPMFSWKHPFADDLPELEMELRPRIEGDDLVPSHGPQAATIASAVSSSLSTASKDASSSLSRYSTSPTATSSSPGSRRHSRTPSATLVPVCGFDLDAVCPCGRIVLLYNRGPSHPQIWMLDLGCRWHFLANSFTDYFRSMIIHLGLPNWQYSLLDIGLDALSQQWMWIFAPERLTYSMDHSQPGRGLDGQGFGGSIGLSPLAKRKKKKSASSKKSGPSQATRKKTKATVKDKDSKADDAGSVVSSSAASASTNEQKQKPRRPSSAASRSRPGSAAGPSSDRASASSALTSRGRARPLSAKPAFSSATVNAVPVTALSSVVSSASGTLTSRPGSSTGIRTDASQTSVPQRPTSARPASNMRAPMRPLSAKR